MKPLLYPLALGLLLLDACSKNAPEAPATVVLDGEYEASRTLTTAPIMLYTKDGAVNNPALADRFLAQHPWGSSHFSRTDAPVPGSTSFRLLIRGNNAQAYFINTAPGRTDTLKTDLMVPQAAYAVSTARDSVSVYTSAGTPSRCALLGAQTEAVAPIKRCVAMPPVTGYSGLCRFRPIRVLRIDAGQLSVPQLSWLVYSSPSPSISCGAATSGSWNMFNKALLTQLAVGDTLVVQERTIALRKK